MVSNKQKGNIAELQFKAILMKTYNEEQIERARPTYKYIGPGRIISSPNDFWSLFDLIVKDRVCTKYIQVKSNPSGVAHAKPMIVEFIKKYGCQTDMFFIAQKVARKGFIIKSLTKDGEITKEYCKLNGDECDLFTQS